MATLRAAQLEVLFTADTKQIQQADKDVKSIGERIEKKPIKQKLTADASEVLSSADRIEAAYKVAFANSTEASARQKRALISNYLESDRAAGKSAAQIQSVLTRSYGIAESAARELAQVASGEIPIKVDVAPALKSMDRVEDAAKKLVSQSTSLKLDADVTRAEKSLDRAKQRLADLEVRALGGLDVTADVRRAEAALSKVERNLNGLRTAQTQIVVDADTSAAAAALDDVSGDAGKAGADSGDEFGKNIITALVSIPIAGAVIGIGVAAGAALIGAFNDGLAQEASYDRLQALTGISEADALRLGRAAGEAYANVFGDSVEANMDTTRLALQFDLIDADTSTRSAQKVVEGLSGIADVLGEDVQPVAAAVTKMLNTGLATSAENAFDILATGAREGVNLGEDLLDTLGEYSSTFSALGLSGDQALGLLNQGLEAGAPNADFFADSIRELGIRVRAGEEATADFLKQAGLMPDSLAKAFTEGGPAAAAGIDSIFDALNAIEDPVERNRVAVGILGTQYEDLQLDLSKLDLTTAVDQLNGVTGSAERMFSTLANNDETKMEQARRNIEVATDGMKGALAAAFSDPLGEAADWISANRGPMLQFFQDLVNGALDFGHTLIDAAADGTEGFGEFVSGPLASVLDIVGRITAALNGGNDNGIGEMADDMKGFKDEAADAADRIRGLHDGLDETAGTFNGFMDGATAMGYLNDASLRLIDTIGEVGVTADGAAYGLDGIDLANIRVSESGKTLEGQVRNSIAAMEDEISAAATAGESQEELVGRYNASTAALVGQLTQMGLTEEEARALIDTVMETPTWKATEFGSNAEDQQAKVQALNDRVTSLDDGTIVITTDTTQAEAAMTAFMQRWNGDTVNLRATGDSRLGSGILQAAGGVVEFMAQGGMRGLTPMSHTAQVVPPSTWRVVGDRGDVPESFIPIDGSARSMSILLETMRRMGVMPMAAGGITAPEPGVRGSNRPIEVNIEVATVQNEDPRILGRIMGREITNALAGRA